MKNCILIGENTGSELPLDSENIVIIGDNIKSLDRTQQNCLFIGDRVVIGQILFGEPINLKEVIERAQ